MTDTNHGSKLLEAGLRRTLFASKEDVGLQALIRLMEIRRSAALMSFRRAAPQDLVRWQAVYNTCQMVIDSIITPLPNIETGDTNA